LNNYIHHSRPTITDSDIHEIRRILLSGNLSTGKEVKSFESNFENFLGVENACAVNSGTSALHLSLHALNLSKSDEVIIPSFVCTALLNAVNYVDAKPVIVDITPNEFNISVEKVNEFINNKTKAIIIPHMFGVPADVDMLTDLGILIIEDCAQSIGARLNKKMVGSFGDLSIFSFYTTKMFTTAGHGGMIASNSKKLIAEIRDLRNYDCGPAEYKTRFNYEMTDIEAAMGSNQLSMLPQFIQKRKEIASIYNEAFAELDNLHLFFPPEKKEPVYYRYLINFNNNINIYKYVNKLNHKGIECKIIIHKLHESLYLNREDFVNTERANVNISLPIYPSLKSEEVDYIVKSVKEVIK